MSTIIPVPKSNLLLVESVPSISCIEFADQIIELINGHTQTLDFGLCTTDEVRALYDCMRDIQSTSERGHDILNKITDAGLITKMNDSCAIFQKLKKLQDLVSELENDVTEGGFDYFNTVAELLVDVRSQMAYFKEYSAVHQVILLKNKTKAVEHELRLLIQYIVREIGPLCSTYPNSNTNNANNSNNSINSNNRDSNGNKREDQAAETSYDLTNILKIDILVDALGDIFRDDLLRQFAQLQLLPYDKLFKLGAKYSGLEYLDQRYAWFKSLLNVVDTQFAAIFPARWEVHQYLYTEFALRTKKQISTILEKNVKNEVDVNTSDYITFLLKSVKSVVSFQSELTATFAAKQYRERKSTKSTNNNSNKSINNNNDNDNDDENENDEQTAKYELSDFISEAFDAYLQPYVRLERRGLEELMQDILSVETEAADGQIPSDPYASSRKMFEYIKSSLKRCATFSTGVTLLSLSMEFRTCLSQYAEALKSRCPAPSFKPGTSGVGGKVSVYKLNKGLEITLSRIICTGEYCVDTVPALENLMKEKINSDLEEKVDFSGEIGVFTDMISFAMTALAAGQIEKMEEYFADMRKVLWGILNDVGDSSPHIKKMIRVLHDTVPRYRQCMSGAYFQIFCGKLASAFLDAFSDCIWSLKRICMTGGAQLLMDLNGIKEYLMKMPNVKLPDGTEPSTISKAYILGVNNKVHAIEVVLKLICTEDNMLAEMFALLWPEGTKDDLDNITALRSKPRNLLPDQVGDMLGNSKDMFKGGAKAVGNSVNSAGVNAVGQNIQSGLHKVGDGFKSAFGEFSHFVSSATTANNGTTTAQGENEQAPPNKKRNSMPTPVKGAPNGDNSSKNSTKDIAPAPHNPFTGLNAALGFMHAGKDNANKGGNAAKK